MKYLKTILELGLVFTLIGCGESNVTKSEGVVNTPPVIKLLGKKVVTIEEGEIYDDAGATANDKEDGDISNKIVMNNLVDINVIGVYKVTYNVEDSNKRKATECIRTVTVVKKEVIVPTPIPIAPVPSVYENAEDKKTDGWNVYTDRSMIKNVYDSEKGNRVIELSGNDRWDASQFSLKNDNSTTIKWSLKATEYFDIFITINTEKGQRTLRYVTKDSSTSKQKDGVTYSNFGIGSNAADGEWHTYTRDIQKDLKRYEPDNAFISMVSFMTYGNLSVDDIELYTSSEGVDVTLPQEVTAPGIVLTFDDSLINDWYAMRDTFREKGVVATFFCYDWERLSKNNDFVAKFKELQDDGHEIAYHTVNHKSTYAYATAEAYLDTEILPGITAMRKDDFEPVSFSYPYISGQLAHNQLIRKELPHIREFFASVKQIDNNDTGSLYSIEAIKEELLRIKNTKEIGVFLAHKILPEANPDAYKYRITTEKLIQLIDEANRLDLKFYTLEEAHNIYMNQ